MGKATITSDLGEGQYAVELVHDISRAKAEIVTLGSLIAEIDEQLWSLTVEIVAQTNAVNAANVYYQEAISTYRAEQTDANKQAVRDRQAEYMDALAKRNLLERKKGLLTLTRAQHQKRIDLLSGLDETIPATAWCADYNEGLSGEVATVEIGRQEIDDVVIKPAGTEGDQAAWADADGLVTPVLSQTAAQAYYNFACQPAAKWLPIYRIGTISDINTEAGTCTVSIEEATVTQQCLDINQTTALTNCPIEYMDCDAEAFEAGDRVVVYFPGDWETAKVIGFAANPRACRVPLWPHDYIFECRWTSRLYLRDDVRGISYMVNPYIKKLYVERMDGAADRADIDISDITIPDLGWEDDDRSFFFVVLTSGGLAFVCGDSAGGAFGSPTVTSQILPVFETDGTFSRGSITETPPATYPNYTFNVIQTVEYEPCIRVEDRNILRNRPNNRALYSNGGYSHWMAWDTYTTYISGTLPYRWPDVGYIEGLECGASTVRLNIDNGVPTWETLEQRTTTNTRVYGGENAPAWVDMSNYIVFPDGEDLPSILPGNTADIAGLQNTKSGREWAKLLAYDNWKNTYDFYWGRRRLREYDPAIPMFYDVDMDLTHNYVMLTGPTWEYNVLMPDGSRAYVVSQKRDPIEFRPVENKWTMASKNFKHLKGLA